MNHCFRKESLIDGTAKKRLIFRLFRSWSWKRSPCLGSCPCYRYIAGFRGIHAHVAWSRELELELGIPGFIFDSGLPLEHDSQVPVGKPEGNAG